ncbi:MAG TPA: mannose-1-phosphate guanylyltransferase [Candidatus Saccharimonadales bacterium]
MIVVIIAGGSGTRLWPLSTPSYPKHLLKVNGDDRSLLQHAYDRALRLTANVFIATEASHVQHVKDQLSDLPDSAFVVEPARRGTAHCIMAALAEIGKQHDADEPIAFIHADHYIRDVAGFAHSFRIAEEVSAAQKRLVLVGVEPDYPATGFGYIQKGELLDEKSFVFNVSMFKEKPDFETAQSYLNSGNYLWNGGYFVGSINTFRRTMQAYAPELNNNYEKLTAAADNSYKETYLAFENIAIDYALIEKTQNLLVVPASFDWMDLGSFSDMYAAANKDAAGNHISGNVELEGIVENSFIENHETDKPVAVIGLDNVVVVNTPDGILVARRDMSQKVGDVAKRLQAK